MKKTFLLYTICAVLLIACSNNKADSQSSATGAKYTPPPPGTLIASQQMPTNDPLNHFNFTVKVLSNEYSNTGTYTVEASWGPDKAEQQFTMPRSSDLRFKPILKKASEPYTYIIGFDYGGKFYDYYQIKGAKDNIEMKYTKAYSFK